MTYKIPSFMHVELLPSVRKCFCLIKVLDQLITSGTKTLEESSKYNHDHLLFQILI